MPKIDAKTQAVIQAARDLDHWLYRVMGSHAFRRLMRNGMPAQNLRDALHRLDGGLPVATRMAESAIIVVANMADLPPESVKAIYDTMKEGETVTAMRVNHDPDDDMEGAE